MSDSIFWTGVHGECFLCGLVLRKLPSECDLQSGKMVVIHEEDPYCKNSNRKYSITLKPMNLMEEVK